VPFDEVLAEADELQRRLSSRCSRSRRFRSGPSNDAVNLFLVDTYRAWWDRMDASHAQKLA
jgi:hypothetical protein